MNLSAEATYFFSRYTFGSSRLIVIVVLVLVSRRNVPSDQREHIQSSILVGNYSSWRSNYLGHLANETFETILRNQKISLNHVQRNGFPSVIFHSFFDFMITRSPMTL